MKQTMIVTIILFTVILVPFAHSRNEPVLYLNVGASAPTAPETFSEHWQRNFNLGGGIGFHLSPNLILQGYVARNNFTLDEDKFFTDYPQLGESVSIDGGELKFLTVFGDLKAVLGPSKARLAPYLIGGGGFSKQYFTDISISGKRITVELGIASETTFAVAFGAGMDINLSDNFALFIEGRYTIGFTENESIKYVPVKIGLGFKL